jgi:hypothetical protein
MWIARGSAATQEVNVRMKTSFILALAACGLLTISSGTFAQQPPPPEQSQRAKAPQTIAGDLTDVDTTAKTLTVKSADGSEVTFKYTEATEISGAKGGAAGLATMKDAKVTVHFTEDSKDHGKTATRVIVQTAK